MDGGQAGIRIRVSAGILIAAVPAPNEHVLEKHVPKCDAGDSREEIRKKLKGLGYMQ